MIAAAVGNETVPAIDEQPPAIGPNLATSPDLCAAVTKYIQTTFWYPYWLIQQTQWQACRMIDNAWRVRYAAQDLNLTEVTRQTVAQSTPWAQDGKAAKSQSPMFFQQIKSITDLGEILSFSDGLPMRAVKPDWIEEDLFYQPTQASADALNAVIKLNVKEVDFRDRYRRAFGCYAKYGYGFVHAPLILRRYVQPVPLQVQGPMAPEDLQRAFPDKEIQFTPQGPMTMEPRLAVRTDFIPVHVEDCYCDPFLSCSDMNQQPCPLIRTFASHETLRDNVYDPQGNPFGFLNTKLAITKDKGHWFLSDPEMQLRVQRLQNRYNLSDQISMGGDHRSRAEQLYTAYVMLGISEDGKLDTGEGVDCPKCMGVGEVEPLAELGEGTGERMPCPHCQGAKKMVVPKKRYIVQMYGGLTVQTTCLRIQEMPEGMDVPIIFSADLVEDDSASIPQGVSQVMLLACEQVTRAECQFEQAKEYTVHRPWVVKWDSPAWKKQNLNEPNGKIPFESDPKEATRADASSYDETATLMPYIEYRNQQLQQIGGATETLLGQISSGRRSALEIGEATEAAKNPLVCKVDRFNTQVCGKWVRLLQKNLELFGDRDYIRRITHGLTYFGKCEVFTEVAHEFVKKLAISQALRETLQVSAGDPVVEPKRADLWNELFQLSGIRTRLDDGGVKRAMQTAMVIINKILAQGIPDPPLPSDPHQIYVAAFEGALKDPYWNDQYPQNMKMLYERLMMQNQLLQQQQQAMMMQQMAMNQMMGGNEGGGPPNAKKGREPAADRGSQNQQAQGG